MKFNQNKKRLCALLMAVMMTVSAGGIGVLAAGAGGSAYVGYSAEEQGEEPAGGDGTGSENPAGGDDTGSQQTGHEEKVQAYLSRIRNCVNEMKSHANAMMAAAKAGDLDTMAQEEKAYAECKKRMESIYDDFCDEDFNYEEGEKIDTEYFRLLEQAEELYKQAKSAVPSNLGGAEDEDGNTYPLDKVKCSVSKVGRNSTMYDMAMQGVGGCVDRNGEDHTGYVYVIYKVTLKVGNTPVHLIGDLTKNASRNISNDIQAKTAKLYQLDMDTAGAPPAYRIGTLRRVNDSMYLSVKVSDAESYFIVGGIPDNGEQPEDGEEMVASDQNGKRYTADQLREMLEITRVEGEEAEPSLKIVSFDQGITAVYSISLPEGFTLLPDALATVELICPEAAGKDVEIFHMVKNEDENADEVPFIAESLGDYAFDSDGRLIFQTPGFSYFVVHWEEEEQPEEVVSPTDTVAESAGISTVVIIWIVAAAAIALVVIAAVVLLVIRRR